jgi:hypothetical protein
MVGDGFQARRYVNAMNLAFFQAYVAGISKYISYLNSTSVQTISSQSLGLSLVQSLSTKELEQIRADHSPLNPFPYNQNWIWDIGYWYFLATYDNFLMNLIPKHKI